MEPNQRIAYISDIGAQGLKPLFIAGSCVTTVFLDLSFAAERWLRHTGRLAKNMGMAEKLLSALSSKFYGARDIQEHKSNPMVIVVLFAVVGTCGLILLSIFDTVNHPRGGYVISAIFICAEYQRLGVHFRQHRILRASFWAKLFFIIVEACLAAVFVGTTFTSNKDIGAVFEWVIALIFDFYVLTFFVDLLPASRNRQATTNWEVGALEGTGRENGNAAMNGHGYGMGNVAVVDGQQHPKPPMAQNY
ncbi:MAG: hypothetical protein Q9174_000174 [Haloplaca sp. 1 TL-2023]